MRLGATSVVAAPFQEARHFTPSTTQRYRDLVERTGFVAALGEGLPAEPLPGVRGAALDPADPVRAEWDLVVLGPHFAAALLARDLGDSGPDLERTFEFALTYERDPDGRVVQYIGVQNDVTARVRAERALQEERDRGRSYLATMERMAWTDPLTGLPNRRRLAEWVEVAVWDARATDGAVALLFLDLDG